MTKDEARTLVSSGTLTWGHLRHRLQQAQAAPGIGQGFPSAVNQSMTHEQALDILVNGIADRLDETKVGTGPRDMLAAVNILRECRWDGR